MWMESVTSENSEHHDHATHHKETGSHRSDHNNSHEHGHGHDKHWLIGTSLALGFAFMLLVDKLGDGYGHTHSHNGSSCI